MTDQTHNTPSQPGLLLIISGPSGVGKTTITHRVEEAMNAVFSVSMTTRQKTKKDTEGQDYFFVSDEAFDQAIEQGELLEHARVFSNRYGTPRKPVETHIAEGRLVILEIDVDGAEQVKQSMPEALALFVLPPSEEELLRRLRARGREGEELIQKRFSHAQAEIARAKANHVYDHFIVNDHLETAVEQAIEVVSQKLRATHP